MERLHIPELVVADGPHGLRRMADVRMMAANSLPATCFPTASLLASSWDVDLLHTLGQAIAEEAITQNVGVVLGPGVNMKRTPLCGRNFEYFSEDPYLSGKLATSYTHGVQDKGVGTSLKHYTANNQEYQRLTISAEVDERTLREIYLPAFEMVVKEAQPWSVMCAYNKVNGIYASEHYELLVDILKNEWGLEGFVVSDWGAVHDRVAALKGGLDLEMPGPKDRRVQAVVEAVQADELDEAILNEAVGRILGIVFKAVKTPKSDEFDVEAHHALARQMAAEGMVLLKNEGLLPLSNQQNIAVIGRSAQKAHFQGGGSSHINPTQVDVPFVELQKLAPQTEFSYAEGYPSSLEFDQTLIDEAVTLAQSAEVALLYIALPSSIESRRLRPPPPQPNRAQVALIKAVCAVNPKPWSSSTTVPLLL